jgi:hypothetical protein
MRRSRRPEPGVAVIAPNDLLHAISVSTFAPQRWKNLILKRL